MPFCPYCVHPVESDHIFCGKCGKALPEKSTSDPAEGLTGQPPRTLAYRISPTRIMVMTLLSGGLYLFYWFYLTWRQYRDHTGNKVFPMWHTLTLTIPGYGLFRTHAHMKSFEELLLGAGVICTINVGWTVFLVLMLNVLGLASSILTGGLFNFGEVSFGAILASTILNIISVAVVLGLILHVQQNLNRYWASLDNMTLLEANVGAGEVIMAVIGVLTWIITLASLVNPAFRAAA